MAQVNMNKPLMPKAAAVWMIDNTALTFDQIADFCGLDSLEIQALADEEVGLGIVGKSPIESKEVTQTEINRCQDDSELRLRMVKSDLPQVKSRSKGPKYTPVSKRGDKPDAIAYVIRNNSEIKDSKICKLIGTTKPTIEAIRNKTHTNSSTIKPRHPAELGLCTYVEYQEAVDKALIALGRDPTPKETDSSDTESGSGSNASSSDGGGMSGFDFSNFMTTKD